MKKLFLLAIIAFSLASCDKETLLPQGEIPAEISDYLNTHFPDAALIQALKDQDELELTYDIALEGGFFLEFNRKKEIIDIDGSAQIPNSVIPEKILVYVQANYPSNFIKGWELDGRNQEIALDNGIDLDFTMEGDFLKIDN
ncbi:MAG: PepSY-like domain-containing protein [Saprospiraceae bacterium]